VLLEKAKKIYELRIGRPTTWDEFLLALASTTIQGGREESVLELTDEEARLLENLVSEGRSSWSKRVLTPMF